MTTARLAHLRAAERRKERELEEIREEIKQIEQDQPKKGDPFFGEDGEWNP